MVFGAGKKESAPAPRPRRKFGAAALGAADDDSDDGGEGNFHPHGFAKWTTVRQKIWGIITNEKTDWVLASMILSSVVILIYDADLTAKKNLTLEEETLQQITNLITGVYTCVYALEMACRVYVFRTEVFTTAMLFDFLIVAADVLLLVIDLALGFPLNLGFLRIFRLVRVFRFVRVVGMFPELQFLVKGFISSFSAVFWGSILMWIVILMWAIIAVYFVDPTYREIVQSLGDTCEDELGVVRNCRAWSSVGDSVITLTQTVVFGDSWGASAIAIIEKNPPLLVIFAGMYATVTLGVLNLIVAAIVDSGAQAREEAQEAKRRRQRSEEQKQKERQKNRLLEICKILDDDESGSLSFDELLVGFERNSEFRNAMKDYNIDRKDLDVLFRVFDEAGTGVLDYQEFFSLIDSAREQASQQVLTFVRFAVMDLRNTWLLKLKFLRELSTWLDAFVLICGWVELIIYQMWREDLYFFRDIRMLRVVRICRVANLVRKTRSLRELRKMITMFSTCARTLAWSLLFCFGMMTMWAMLLVELVNPLCCLTDAACTQCSKATGSIMEANLLLFKTVIVGDSWGTIAVPIIEAAPLTAIIFCGSLLTLVFGVLNLVVVVVVDTFAETRDRDMMNLAEELEFTHEDDKKQLLKMFVTLSELIQGVRKDRELQSRLRVMDIDEVDLEQLFYMIDADGSGTVEAEEFVTPLSRWVHDSKTATRFIKYNLMRHMQQQEAFMQDVSSRLDRLQEYVAPAIRASQRWEEIPPPTGIPQTSMRTSLRWELIPPPPASRRSQTAGATTSETSPALIASEGEVESPKSSALEWLQKADAEQPTDKIVTSTRLAEEDSLKAALVHAENLLVASNKELLERSLQAMKGVFHGAVQETGSPSSAKPRSMSEEHSDAPTKQKPMAYSELSEKSESSKTTDPEAPVATSQEKAFFRTAPGSSDPDCMQTDQSAAQISVSVRLKRGTRDICGI